MTFPYFLSQPFLFSTLEFYRSAKEAISLATTNSFRVRRFPAIDERVFDERVSKGEI
jgi:hypothetical protein